MGATADWRDYENNFNLVAMIVVEPLCNAHGGRPWHRRQSLF
jgi:hypothetical protein